MENLSPVIPWQWSDGHKRNSMLQQFTWQHFLVAAMVLTVIWYAAVFLIFYRRGFSGLFGKRNAVTGSERLPHKWEKGVDRLAETDDRAEPELMGKSRLPDGVSRVTLEEIRFAGNGDEKQQQVGLVPDVIQEIKEVFSLLAAQDGNKNDFFGLMETVRQNYPKISSNPNIGSLNKFIVEHAPFHLSAEELENLWN